MYYVYILTNKTNEILYIGVTNDLRHRVYEHVNELVEGFTKKYRLDKLVYYEEFHSVMSAIEREKQLKKWTRFKKNKLVETKNSEWQSLNEMLFK